MLKEEISILGSENISGGIIQESKRRQSNHQKQRFSDVY